MKPQDLFIIAVLAIIGALFLSASTSDYEVELQAQSQYCENVKLWESSTLPKNERAGHPNFKDLQC